MVIKLLDILRIVLVLVAFFFGHLIGFTNGYHPVPQLHFMIPVIIVAIAGISGLEGVFLGRRSAAAKGFETGSNYQKQSAIAMLSYPAAAILAWFFNWGIRAELTILFAFIFFFFFSAVNHTIDAVVRKNYRWQNINRPFLTLLIIAGMIYPVIMALKNLP
ncbi:MAG: DUF6790 family protein [Bacteroidota bacterium]